MLRNPQSLGFIVYNALVNAFNKHLLKCYKMIRI